MATRLATCIGISASRRLQTSAGLVRTALVPSVRKSPSNVVRARLLSNFSALGSRGVCLRVPARRSLISRHCSSSTTSEQQVLDKMNQEMTAQPQSKLFAVVHVCGRQFKIAPSDLVIVHKLQAEIGESIYLEKVLMAGSENFTLLGTPMLNPSIVRVKATVVEHGRAAKIVIFKKKRRKNYKRKKGYRQDNTTLRINSIELKPTLS